MRICPKCNTPSLKDSEECVFCGAAMVDPSQTEDDPMVGLLISDKFELKEIIGSGGMGKVYRADQVGVGRTVAVKIMHRHLMGDETAGARCTNEARAASQLNHPNSISVLDFGQTTQGFLYIVYEYLRGHSLDHLLRHDFPVPFGRVADLLCQAMEAVQAAHELGIIHRDLKPENIFLVQTTGYDFVKVLDFGIAKIQALRDRSITSPGMVPGTPEYMSPEQARGESLGPTSDVYSLGVILYELLTATVPFYGESVVATMMAHVQDPPVPPTIRCPERQIPKELEAITLKALAKRPPDRYPSATKFKEHLAEWAQAAGVWVPLEQKDTSAGLPITAKAATTAAVLRDVGRVHTRSTVAADEGIAPTPLVGRDAELKQIDAFLSPRGARALRIHGAVGMGKSRLVTEILRRAAARGLEGIHCRPDPGPVPTELGAARRVALRCLDLPAETETCGLEDLLLAASRIGLHPDEIPGLQDLFGIPGHLSQMTHATRRRERETAFRHVVHRAATARPLLLVFDGFHEFDRASQELIAALAEELADAPLAIVVSHSSDLKWHWSDDIERFRLLPLSKEASTELVQSLFSEEVPASDLEQICAASQGSPLFVEQLAYAWLIDGEEVVPERLADLLAARTARLPQEHRSVLQWAAVLDDEVTARSIGLLSGEAVDRQLLVQLEELGLLKRGEGRHTYAFIHPLLAKVTYSSIPAEVRRNIHLRVYEHLRRSDAPAATLAYHAYEADAERAIEELDQAGALSLQVMDLGAASGFLSRALEMVRREWGKGRMGEGELERTAVELARRLATVLMHNDQAQMARGVLEEALSVAAANDSTRAELRIDLGRVDLEQGNLQRAARHLELARLDAERCSSDFLAGEALRELARAVGLLGEKDRASELLLLSVDASRRASGQRGEPGWKTLLALATTCRQLGLDERAQGYLLDALQEAGNASSIPGKLLATVEMAMIHLGNNEWSAAEMRLAQALDLVGQTGDRTMESNMHTELGRLQRIKGEVEKARRELEQALKLARSIRYTDGIKRAQQEIEMLRYARPQAL
jgi:serine/threonine-protein kinase